MNPPLFIIGNPRSGTTLLRLMLTCHPRIVIPPECGFAVWLYDRYKSWTGLDEEYSPDIQGLLHDVMTSKKFETWGISHEALNKMIVEKRPSSYADFVSRVYELYGQRMGRSFDRWGDKNNYYLNHISTIKEIFPEVSFIHIVRDGRDVACSYIDLGRRAIESKYAPKLPEEINDIADDWKNNVNKIRDSFGEFRWENVIEIRYEDLVIAPDDTLGKICSFLKEEYDPNMLEYYHIIGEFALEPKEFLQWKEKTREPPSIGSIGRYETEFNLEQRRLLNYKLTPLLEIYGYQI